MVEGVAESRNSRRERLSFYIVFVALGCVAGILLAAPTIIVLIASFTDSYTLKFPPPGYSVRWYRALLGNSPEIVSAAWLSLKIAIAATAIGVVLAVAAALALARQRAAWARLLDAVFMA